MIAALPSQFFPGSTPHHLVANPHPRPRLLPAPRLVCLPVWCSLEDGDGSGCNMLLLPLDLARHLANSNETLLCPNCLAGRQQASPAQRWLRSGRKA